LFEYGLMLHYCVTGRKITINDLRYAGFDTPKPGGGKALPDNHASWAMERKLLQLVEEGNPDYKKLAGKLAAIGNLSNLGNNDSIRHYKNLTIIFTALCTRAAIRGGVPPEIAYTLSDNYIRSIEGCKNLAEIAEINSTMQEDFVRRARQAKTNGGVSPQVQKVRHYVQTHLTEKISIPILAAYVGYSETYISKKFKKETGRTIVDYINASKIEHATELLISDERPIGEIAEELGFHSQSYFCERFREYAGVAPSEYRLKQKNGSGG
jgi:AraC-like DNA-binding protein